MPNRDPESNCKARSWYSAQRQSAGIEFDTSILYCLHPPCHTHTIAILNSLKPCAAFHSDEDDTEVSKQLGFLEDGGGKRQVLAALATDVDVVRLCVGKSERARVHPRG